MGEAVELGPVLQREERMGDVLVGVHRARVTLQAAARREWGKFVASVT